MELPQRLLTAACENASYVRLVLPGGKHRAPAPLQIVAHDLEEVGPLLRVGDVAARAAAQRSLEVEQGREHQEALRPGVALEFYVEALAHGAAPAVAADHVVEDVPLRALGRDAGASRVLGEAGHARSEPKLDVRPSRQAFAGRARTACAARSARRTGTEFRRAAPGDRTPRRAPSWRRPRTGSAARQGPATGIPRKASSSASISRVEGCVVAARGLWSISRSASKSATCMPFLAQAIAATTPTGPAPTMPTRTVMRPAVSAYWRARPARAARRRPPPSSGPRRAAHTSPERRRA